MKISVKQMVVYLESRGLAVEVDGDENTIVQGYSSICDCADCTLTWAKNEKVVVNEIVRDRVGLVVVCPARFASFTNRFVQIICDNPKAAFFSVVRHFFCKEPHRTISSHAIVETAAIGENVGVGHFSYIGPEVEIGNDVVIGHHVTIECPCKIGAHSRIGSGTVIGNLGFGFYKDVNGIQQRVPHTGAVMIGEFVEIDANVCIDRGTIGNTIIGDYAKIDNFVQIAHNDTISPHALIISHAVIAGSVEVGARAYIAPGALVMNQKRVGADSLVGAGSVVIGNVRDGKVVAGNPASVLWENRK